MKILAQIYATLVTWVYRLWCGSLCFSESGRGPVTKLLAEGEHIITCLWHNELFPAAHFREDWKMVSIVSRSQDGEYLALFFQKLGIVTARGSSSRGGADAALRVAKLIRDQNHIACITVDGPRGPRHEPKGGAIQIAHLVSGYIVPCRLFMKKAKVFQSWDRFQLPLPFSRVHAAFGEPYKVMSSPLDTVTIKNECAILKKKLNAMMPPEEGFMHE